jgi:hypothetical protein
MILMAIKSPAGTGRSGKAGRVRKGPLTKDMKHFGIRVPRKTAETILEAIDTLPVYTSFTAFAGKVLLEEAQHILRDHKAAIEEQKS